MLMTEKELSIEVAQIDCIKIDDVDLSKTSEYEVFQELTSDSTSTNKKNTGL